ncbi:MAG: hypothetical protein PUD36_06495 [Bacteroidales bacterium]|nr:hypothetical protein [Bacteroidales bacterium]
MIQITSRELRENMDTILALADKGEDVVICRNGKVSYMLTPIYEITPELEKKIEEGRKEYQEGKIVSCANKDDLNSFLDSL